MGKVDKFLSSDFAICWQASYTIADATHASPLPLWRHLRHTALCVYCMEPTPRSFAITCHYPCPLPRSLSFHLSKASNFVKHMKTNKTLTYLDLSHNLIGSQVRTGDECCTRLGYQGECV